MTSTSSRSNNGTGSINAGQPRNALSLPDVLRQLAVSAVDCILDELGRDSFSSARLACKALRGFVDANVCDAKLCFSCEDAMRPRPGFTSPLARFRRSSCLSINFKIDKAGEHDVNQHPAQLASLCVAGVGADMARNITELHLKGPLELPSLVTVAVVLAGTLQHVRILALDTWPYGMGGFGFKKLYGIHATLRAAFPALEELNLPARACLRGLEAFAGSRLHTVRAMAKSFGPLRMPHVRSLVQLPQLRELDLAGVGWDAQWRGGGDDDVWDDEKADRRVRAAELPPGDASDEDTFWGMDEAEVREVWALRRLLVSPPPALERLRWLAELQEVGFAGGRITYVHLNWNCRQPGALHCTAAVLLPVLAATGRRLPLLKVKRLADYPADIISLLQPHTLFSRLLAVTDSVELGQLELGHLFTVDGTAAEAAATLQAVVRAVGGMPEELQCGPYGHGRLTLQTRPRYSAGAGGDRHAAGSTATAAAPAVMLAEVTAQQVLERAAARMWDTAEAKAAATVAQAGAEMAAYMADNSRYRREELVRMHVLLRGPFVWQLTCGPGASTRAPLLMTWLKRLSAAPGSQADAAAGAPRVVADTEMQSCSFAACGSGSAVALVECGDPIAALQLYRAAAAAAGETPGCLQVSVCEAGADGDMVDIIKPHWAPAINEVIRELWDDHLGSTPVLAAPMAAAGQGLAGGQERPGQAAADQGGAAARRDEAVVLECDLQVLQRLLLLVEQAHDAVDIV